MPLLAHRVEDAPSVFTMAEHEYVRGLKRKESDAVMRVIQGKRTKAESAPLRIRVLQSAFPEALKVQLFRDLRSPCAPEKLMQWVLKALALPLGRVLHPPRAPSARAAIEASRAAMDAVLVGHETLKREILQLACQGRAGGGKRGYALGLEGPPGTGKTHFVREAMPVALGLPIVSIPLGGAIDISYLLGSLYTYEGSKEGRLAAALTEAGCSNPIIHFDEVDKVSTTERGQEIVSTLIHLVDPSANATLRDRYFHGIDLDFSRCTFVFSYNDPSRISPVLLDRIRRVAVPAPAEDERRRIVVEHLVPRTAARLGVPDLALEDGAVDALLQGATPGGMRELEKRVEHVLAAAQLALALEAVDATGPVTAAFARAHVAARDVSRDAPPPPPGMYT